MERDHPIVTKLGTRKVQYSSNSHILSIPRIAVVSLGWGAHDKIDVSMINNEYLIIKKVIE